MWWQQSTFCVDWYLQVDQTLYLITLAITRGICPGHTTHHMLPMPAGTPGIMDHVGDLAPHLLSLFIMDLSILCPLSSLCGPSILGTLSPSLAFVYHFGVHGDVCLHWQDMSFVIVSSCALHFQCHHFTVMPIFCILPLPTGLCSKSKSLIGAKGCETWNTSDIRT